MEEGGTFSPPVNVPTRDISSIGLSFYEAESMETGSKLRITLFISKTDKVSFIARVIRMELAEDVLSRYVIGVEIEEIEEADRQKIEAFLDRINIFNILDEINLDGISDIHFVVGYPPVVKRFGMLEEEGRHKFDEDSLRILLLNLLDKDLYKKFSTSKEVNFIFSYRDKERFRVNLHIQRGKVEGVFRLIPSRVGLPHEIGLPTVVERLLKHKSGLILVAGRTGAGKTTTLVSMVGFLNENRKAIVISIEDPIEYLHTNKKCIIKQREIGRDTLSFSGAAKNALRQNPDILVIGEILDEETMEVALTAAESGTLVLTSIHAPNTTQALDRAVSLFPADVQPHVLTRLSLITRGVITQELIPRLDGTGLVVATEVLIMNTALQHIVKKGQWNQIPTILETGRNIGMAPMKDSLERLYQNQLIDGEYLK